MRSTALNCTGVALPPNTAAPPGVAQMSAVLAGKLISNEPLPHTNSKSGRYTALESLKVMQAVSGCPFLEYRREDPGPDGRPDFLTDIRSRVNPRSFHQRRDPVLGCTGVQGRTGHTGIAVRCACRRESGPFQDTRSSSD